MLTFINQTATCNM